MVKSEFCLAMYLIDKVVIKNSQQPNACIENKMRMANETTKVTFGHQNYTFKG